MKIRLKDIIDLEYLISMDDALDSKEGINSRVIKDRKIYRQSKNKCQTRKALLLSWLAFRKAEFFRDGDRAKNKKRLTVLPGTIFSVLYTWMAYAMVSLGGIAGISLAYSFLAYYGARPINVTVFIALFIVLPAVLIMVTLIVLVRRGSNLKNRKQRLSHSIIHTLVSSLFFNVLPRILKKADGPIFKKSLDTMEYTSFLIRMKNREYRELFFWPFCILPSVFAFSFSTGAFTGTFFRVIVSDMAFGWQSTLMATSARVHDMVSFMALPWSWFMPENLAHPSLEQIEGSRIILKDGISVLATQDLISWWPFICLGILFYAVIPRGLLILTEILAQNHVLQQFNLERPVFKQLIVRMESPVLDIDADETPVRESPLNQTMEKTLLNERRKRSSAKPEAARPGGKALLLASKSVYTDAAVKKVIQYIETYLFFDVKELIGINFNFDDDTDAVRGINTSDADQVILIQEVWQPPIRGLLHYMTQIKAIMPEDRSLWILLTRDAGQEDLFVEDKDIDFEIWKKAVFKLGNPDIVVKRLIAL